MGIKSERGKPQKYDEPTKPRSVSATPTGVQGFDALAKTLGYCRSELFESLGRNEFILIPRTLRHSESQSSES